MYNTYPGATGPEAFDGNPQPSYFEGMDSPEQVLPEYEHLMGEAASKHQQKFTESYNPANLGTYLNETSEEVGSIVATAAAALAPMLDEESSAMLTHIRGRAKLMGPDSFIVEDLVRTAPLAVRVMFDADVLQEARKRTMAWGADLTESSPRRQILNNASSPTALGAMNAALDKELHDYAQQQTPYERNTLGGKRVFNGASSEAVREALEQERASEHSQQTQGARTDQSRSRGGFDPESVRIVGGDLFKGKAGEAVFNAIFGNVAEASHDNTDSASLHASDTASPGPKEPAKPVDSAPKVKVNDTRAIASKAVAADKHNRWLLDDLPLVEQVLNDLSEGESAGVTPDKTVRAYHLAAQRGDPIATEKVKVIHALPKNPDGTLQR